MQTSEKRSSVCPSPNELKAYVRGKLDSEKSDLLSQHMLHCLACEQTIVEIEAEPDTLVELLKCEIAVSASAASLAGTKPNVQRLENKTLPHGLLPGERSDGLQMPTELGQYELQRRLGAGGMGAVYLARHKSLDKQVAIKLLPALPAQHPGFLARFQREMRAAGKLDHPAIVRTTDAGELQGIHFLVMEAIDGMDLSRIVRVEEKLSIADACEIVRQAAIGLAHAHEKGIVHRDVKPSNLMLDGNGQVRILDFGLAQVGLWDSGSAEITTVGQLMGTLDYMAPEQAERGGAVDYRADLYSLGSTLFRLLTGRAPLAAAPNLTPLEKLRLLATHKPPKLRSLRGDVPESLSQIVDAMLSREPAQRPASATHAAELLESFGVGADLVGLLNRAQSKPQIDEASFSINPLLQRDLADCNLSQPKDRSESPSNSRSDNPKANVSSRSEPRQFSHWLTGTALAGSVAMLCAGVLFILETNKGQLVIDSQADVQVKIVAVDDAGKRSDVDDLQISPGSKATRLKSGMYEIVLDAASDSFGITNGAFTIRNGQIVVATITPKTSNAGSEQNLQANVGKTESSPANVEDPRLNEVVYDGQTLDTWLRRLKFERNEAEVERTFKALIALADPSLRDVMLPPITDFAKRYKQQHLGYVAAVLSKLCGPTLPETAARMLADFGDEETKELFLDSVTSEIRDVGTQGFTEFLAETKKMLGSNSQERVVVTAKRLRDLIGYELRTKVPAAVQSQIVQMFVDTPRLTNENFWLAFPGQFGDAGNQVICNEIVKRAIGTLSDAASSEKLKCQAAIALVVLFERNISNTKITNLSQEDRVKLARIMSADIANLIEQPSQVDSTVVLPREFNYFVAAKLNFSPRNIVAVENWQDAVASPYVLRMHLIDACDLRESLKSELQNLNQAMRQLPIGHQAISQQIARDDRQVLYGWNELRSEIKNRSVLGAIVYLQSGVLLGIPRQELNARFEESLPADLAKDLDQELDSFGSDGLFRYGPVYLAKLPFENSKRAGLVFEKVAVKHLNNFQINFYPLYCQLWIRASGEDFLSSYTRALAIDQTSWPALSAGLSGANEASGFYPTRTSPLLEIHFDHLPNLRCSTPDKLQPFLSFCDEVIKKSELQVAQRVAEVLRSLANSSSPKFNLECRELVVKQLTSTDRLDETNFWFQSSLEPQDSRPMRVATITKAIERLTADSEMDVVDCQALVICGQSTNEDWKEISPELQRKFINALRQQLEMAVEDRSKSAKLIELPENFRQYAAPVFLTVGPYHQNKGNFRSNHVVLILNLLAKPAVNLPNETRESLRPQLAALHECIAKLNLSNPTLSNGVSSWKHTLEQATNIDEFIWHTWYTQTGDLLGKSYSDLANRPNKLAAEENERLNRFVQPGDTLAIYIPKVLPLSGEPPVIQAGIRQPVTGFPVPVSREGTIQLPQIELLTVKDLELHQVLAAIEESYIKHNVLVPNRGPLGITVQYLLRAGDHAELRNIAGSQAVTIPTK